MICFVKDKLQNLHSAVAKGRKHLAKRTREQQAQHEIWNATFGRSECTW